MDRKTLIFLNSVAFVIGFTLIFSVVGILLQTVLFGAASGTINILRIVGGAIITVFGISLIASLKYNIPFLRSEHKIKVKRYSNTYISSFVFGIAFAIGWTPCVGAILGSIYTLAAVSPGIGFLLLFAYSLGIGIPFLLAGLFTSRVAGFLEKSQKLLKYFNIISGLLLIFIGLLVVFNYIGILATFLVGPSTGMAVTQLNVLVAVVAGILTFISPCILPLVPAFLSYMAGTTAAEIKGGKK